MPAVADSARAAGGGVERLQPALLDRLRDDEPSDPREGRDRLVIGMRQLREALRRDLLWLFNAKARPAADPIWSYPRASRSVLNFGVPDLTGLPGSATRERGLEGMTRDAIEAFEPRIVRDTLGVKTVAAEDDPEGGHLYMTEIRGEACPIPIAELLYLRADVDLDAGRCVLRD